jgi:hypothetical protein
MPPKDKRVVITPLDAAKMPRNPAEDALLRLTLAGDDLFKDQVLARLEPTDRGMLRLTSKALRLTMYIDEQLDRKLEVSRFIGSEKSFDWALKNNLGSVGCCLAIGRYAARNGHLELLKMIKRKADIPIQMRPFGIHPVSYIWQSACETTHLDVLQWVYRSTIPDKEVHDCWKQLYKANAALGYNFTGHIGNIGNENTEVVAWLCDTFPQINSTIRSSSSFPRRAAEKGQLEMLKWLIESLGHPMTPILCAKAAASGHLEVLMWLRGKGCDWTVKVSKDATDHANLHITRYAIEHGCKWCPQWTLDQLENIDEGPQAFYAGYYHHEKVQTGTVHENFGEDLQWIIQRAHQQIIDDKLAAEEKQRRKDEKERRAAQKRKAD